MRMRVRVMPGRMGRPRHWHKALGGLRSQRLAHALACIAVMPRLLLLLAWAVGARVVVGRQGPHG